MASKSTLAILVLKIIYLATAATVDSTEINDSDTKELEKTWRLLDTKANGVVDVIQAISNVFDPILTLQAQLTQSTRKTQGTDAISFEEDAATCIDNLDDIIDSLTRKKMWALKILDSNAKIPTGLLSGNVINLGDYDQCISSSSELNAASTFYGQYCLVSLVVEVPPEVVFDFTGSSAQDMFGSNLVLKTAICVPSSCKAKTIEHAFNDCLDKINPWLNKTKVPVALRVAIPDSDCHISTMNDKFSFAEWTVLIILIIISSLVILSTLFDIWLRSCRGPCFSTLNRGPRAVLAFSAYSNCQRLFSTEHQPNTISCINGLRVLNIAWVCLGHRIKFMAQLPATNLTLLLDMIRFWPTMMIVNATLAVDTFFVISGLLNAYTFLTFVDKSTPLSSIWFVCMFKRILRLTPAFAAMIAFTSTLLYKIGDGPLWEQLAGQERESCQEHWWVNLLYINNYYGTNKVCMMQSWYLSVDFQLYAASLFLLFLLKRKKVFGLLLMSALLIISIVVPFVISYLEQLRAQIPLTRDAERVNKEMAVGYFPTHMRASSYIVGLFAGYFLHQVKTEKLNEATLSIFTVRRSCFWIFAIIMMMSSLFLCYWLFQPEEPYLWFYSSSYIAMHRFMWAFGIAWIIIDCTFKKEGTINRFLSCKFFMPLGRLTYCIYLTHVAVIIYKLGTARQPTYISSYDQFHETIGDLVVSIMFAIILALLFESPIMVLEKSLFFNGGKFHGNNNHQSSSRERLDDQTSSSHSSKDLDFSSSFTHLHDNSTVSARSFQSSLEKLKKACPENPSTETCTVKNGKNLLHDESMSRNRKNLSHDFEGRTEFLGMHHESQFRSCSLDYRKQYRPHFSDSFATSEVSYSTGPYTKIDYEHVAQSHATLPHAPRSHAARSHMKHDLFLGPSHWQNLVVATYTHLGKDTANTIPSQHPRVAMLRQRKDTQDNSLNFSQNDRFSNSVTSTYGVNNPVYHYATGNFDDT